ncbi:hypothetical protein GJ631_10515 [Natronomonas sp. CBA1123]|uniref:hypothetical protein n=1 Tax=Natronomonas sp. CBA1123 TaxID=2668070 RepID=UPI0012EAE401|nr:hypothetical protein [Natronomonas sp. CBA1123]MUV86986.1 hypothetical protein [Natronomonas sp. CBA1123]
MKTDLSVVGGILGRLPEPLFAESDEIDEVDGLVGVVTDDDAGVFVADVEDDGLLEDVDRRL